MNSLPLIYIFTIYFMIVKSTICHVQPPILTNP